MQAAKHQTSIAKCQRHSEKRSEHDKRMYSRHPKKSRINGNPQTKDTNYIMACYSTSCVSSVRTFVVLSHPPLLMESIICCFVLQIDYVRITHHVGWDVNVIKAPSLLHVGAHMVDN